MNWRLPCLTALFGVGACACATIDDTLAVNEPDVLSRSDAGSIRSAPLESSASAVTLAEFHSIAELCDPVLDCMPGTVPELDAAVSCTSDSCDESLDIIVNTASDNRLRCDGAERCDVGFDCQPWKTA